MTRNEIMLAAAKKRLEKANTALGEVWERANDALRKARAKYVPKELAAAKSVAEARAEVTRLELLSHGITPMHTIFRWRGDHYAVRIKKSGFYEAIYVKANNLEHHGRNPRSGIYNWPEVTITDRILIVGE